MRSANLSRRIPVDTSAYFPLTDVRQSNHRAAIAVRAQLVAERWRLFTTNYLVAETHALILIRFGRHLAATLLSRIDQSPTTIVRVSYRDEQQARAIIYGYDDKNFSLTDAISFAVMERLRIPTAFSFAHNFAQYGFSLLGA